MFGTKIAKLFDMDEDIITIHIGKVLPQEQYDAIVRSVVEFINANWSNILTLPGDIPNFS